MSCEPSWPSLLGLFQKVVSILKTAQSHLNREDSLQRKLTLTVIIITLVLLGGVTGQTAQAKSNMFRHPSYIVRGLLCIHTYEGSWSDHGAPYWGGLQMDMSFQKTYGWLRRGPNHVKWYFVNKWGTADHWPKWAQVLAGIHAYWSRRWDPWPNTAHYCGLR